MIGWAGRARLYWVGTPSRIAEGPDDTRSYAGHVPKRVRRVGVLQRLCNGGLTLVVERDRSPVTKPPVRVRSPTVGDLTHGESYVWIPYFFSR